MELQIGKYTVNIGVTYSGEFDLEITQEQNELHSAYDADFPTESEALSKALEVIKADSEIKETIWVDGQKIEYRYDPVEDRHSAYSFTGDFGCYSDTKLGVLQDILEKLQKRIKPQPQAEKEDPEMLQMAAWLSVLRNQGKITYKGFQWLFTEAKSLNGYHALELIDSNPVVILRGEYKQLAKSLIEWTAANTKPVVNRDDEIAKILDLICNIRMDRILYYQNSSWHFTYSLNSDCFKLYNRDSRDQCLKALTIKDLAVKLYEWSIENDSRS